MSTRTKPIKDIKIDDGLGETWDFDDPRWTTTVEPPRQVRLTATKAQTDAADATDRRPTYRRESEATRPRATTVKSNRYPGDCPVCGQRVAAEAGRLVKVDGKWGAQHLDGQCPTTTPAAEAPAVPETDETDIPDGHYALASSGSNDLAFYRVDRPTDGKWAGYTFVKSVVGGRTDVNVPRNQKAGILARIAEAGIAESLALYGISIGRCGACNRTLTDETSRSLGLGPDCRKRLGY